MRIVVLGGYGNFGARISRALALDHALTVVATGRRPDMAPADFASKGIHAAPLDLHSAHWRHMLSELKPDIVIHCIGPFQHQSYEVPRAALACGAHYIDLADGRDFVAGFGAALNEEAIRARRLAVTGASTLPALSSAVVDAHIGEFSLLDSIETLIAPGQHAPRGAATLAAVFSYLGQPFAVWHEGQWRQEWGWMSLRTLDLGPLGKRRSAVCDVPDLALFPARYHGLRSARFRAALEVGVQHLGLAGLAWLRRWGVPLPVATLVPLMERTARVFDALGTGTGGMTVTLSGAARDGRVRRLRWQVIAPDNHGPEIPCMAAIILARKLAAGQVAQIGAQPCMGLVTLGEFGPEFAKWKMHTTWDILT